MTFNNELSEKKEENNEHINIMYSVLHSMENGRVCSLSNEESRQQPQDYRRLKEIEAERKRDPERRPFTAEEKEKEKKHLIVLLLASLAGTDRNRLRYLTLYNSVTFPDLDQLEEEEESWSNELHVWLCVYLAPVGSVTHTHT